MNSRNHFKKWHLSIASLTLIGCVFISFLLMDAKAGKSADLPASITGGKLFINKGCAACHITGGSQIAPDLTNVYLSQRRLGDDTTVVADDAYLKQSIVAPQAKLVKGYAPAMPAYDSLEEAEISLLIAYLKSL